MEEKVEVTGDEDSTVECLGFERKTCDLLQRLSFIEPVEYLA